LLELIMKKSLYVLSEGVLTRKDNTLCFHSEEGKRFLPVENVREIFVFSEVEFNKRFLELLSTQEILLHYFNYYGYYMGSFYPREHLNSGFVILKQAAWYQDERKRLDLSRRIVMGAVENMLKVLKYYQSRGKPTAPQIETIETWQASLPDQKTIPALMAVEGRIRETYYQAFDRILEDPYFVFERRTRRPPKNALNALISFGNAVFYTICLSEIYKTHLDPRIGFLHTTNFRRFSLNLDVAEIFKPIVIDRIIFSLIGHRQIQEGDFEPESGGLLMTEKARKTYLAEIDKRMERTIRHRDIGRPVSYRRLIRLELYKIEKHIMEEKVYEPFIARW
jgi:CRISP-associated protein Cas1